MDKSNTGEIYTPNEDVCYVPWGEFNSVKKIIESEHFCPTFISGLSGNGKTMMVEQACAVTKRNYIRVQISPETDESDLLGGFGLVKGETIFNKGPVIKAMENGAVLLLDEIDRGSNKMLCLQGILEGKPVLLKKTGELITPKNGFTVFATANTKGRGSDDGKFSGANIIDEAFLERYVITIEQPYPSPAIEKKILDRHMKKYEVSDSDFVERLVEWSKVIRKTYESGAVEELISTRRLCHIIMAYSIFGNRLSSIKMCISRFDQETHEAFLDLYTKIDDSNS